MDDQLGPDPDAGPTVSLAEVLAELEAMRAAGEITDAGFEAAKARLLGLPETSPTDTPPTD